MTPLDNSNTNTNGETGYSLPLSPDNLNQTNVTGAESAGYRESLGKILSSLQDRSNPYELHMADLFTRILQFEK